MSRLPARLRAEASSRAGRITAAKRREARAQEPPRAKAKRWRPKRVPVDPRRIIACQGVPRFGRSPAYVCKRRLLYKPGGGRPPSRCGHCRVLYVFHNRFSDVDPRDIVIIIGNLARAGLIGPAAKTRAAWAHQAANNEKVRA